MRYSTLVIFPSLCQPGGQVESHDAPAGHHTLHLPTHCRLASHIYTYLILFFYTRTHFDSCKFYTWKVRKFTTKLPSDKTASLSVKFYTEFYTEFHSAHSALFEIERVSTLSKSGTGRVAISESGGEETFHLEDSQSQGSEDKGAFSV